MKLKEKVLEAFENNRGQFLSGETLAKLCGVSRNSVWKTVNSLKQDGYEIQSVTKKGYKLSENTDALSTQGIAKYLNFRMPIDVYREVISTNILAKSLAISQKNMRHLIVAEQQTGGRGRKGRVFFSPGKSGVYFSILLPADDYEKLSMTTVLAAVAVTNAIKNVFQKETYIKWVNDIFLNSKKICGILTEAETDMENGDLSYVVVGIGINVYPPKCGFPAEIVSIATSLQSNDEYVADARNKIVANVVNEFFKLYDAFDRKYIADAYRKHSFIIGKNILYGEKHGTVIDIDDDCRLIIRTPDGAIEKVFYGEIQICYE